MSTILQWLSVCAFPPLLIPNPFSLLIHKSGETVSKKQPHTVMLQHCGATNLRKRVALDQAGSRWEWNECGLRICKYAPMKTEPFPFTSPSFLKHILFYVFSTFESVTVFIFRVVATKYHSLGGLRQFKCIALKLWMLSTEPGFI